MKESQLESINQRVLPSSHCEEEYWPLVIITNLDRIFSICQAEMIMSAIDDDTAF